MRGPFIRLVNAAGLVFRIGVQNLSANRNIAIDASQIAANRIPRLSGDATVLGFVDASTLGNGGTVQSVSLGTNAQGLLEIANPTTTPTIDLDTQAANQVFAGPATGVPAAPTFRLLGAADIPSIPADKISSGTVSIDRLPVGTSASTVAAGNDSRLHTQNTDTGTTAVSFQLDTGFSGPRIKNESNALAVRNAADDAYADVIVRNLVVQGTQTTVNSETITLADNILILNSDEVGTPTQDAGFEVERGTAENATLLWKESIDRFVAGLVGAPQTIALSKVITFTNASLTAGKATIVHGLNDLTPGVTVWFADGYVYQADVRVVDANTIELDFGGAIATGTHSVKVVS